jgi:hypothetical protein
MNINEASLLAPAAYGPQFEFRCCNAIMLEIKWESPIDYDVRELAKLWLRL